MRRDASSPLGIVFAVLAVIAGSGPARAAEPPGLTILDAVRSTVALHPLIQAAAEDVNASLARRLQTTGIFDLHNNLSAAQARTYTPLTNYEHALAEAAGIDTFSQTQNSTDLSGQSIKLLSNGISFGSGLDLSRLTDNLENLGGVNMTHLNFRVDLPLKRGRGRDVVMAPERASDQNAAASALERNETIASLVLQTADNYWAWLAALRTLEIRRASERRGAEFLSSVQALIAAQRMPGVEVHEARANLDAQITARIEAEGRVAEARQNLGYAMGIGAGEAISLPAPAETFPEQSAADEAKGAFSFTTPPLIDAWIARALTLRPAYLATEQLTGSADTLRRAARNQLLPQLDVIVQTGYSGLWDGDRPQELFYSIGGRVQGPDVSAGIRYSFTPGNHAAQGQVAEAEANYRKSLLLRTDTSNRIAASVVSALADVQTSGAALQRAARAVSEYEVALEGANEKMRLAAGSLLDLLTVEARLTTAQLDLVNAQYQYALAIAQLRYASGTLLGPDPMHPSLDREAFFVPPPPPGQPATPPVAAERGARN